MAYAGTIQYTASPAYQYSNPYIIGFNIIQYWNQIEYNEGQYDWSGIDSTLATMVANDKKACLRVSPNGQAQFDSPSGSGPASTGVPSWLFTKYGVGSITVPDQNYVSSINTGQSIAASTVYPDGTTIQLQSLNKSLSVGQVLTFGWYLPSAQQLQVTVMQSATKSSSATTITVYAFTTTASNGQSYPAPLLIGTPSQLNTPGTGASGSQIGQAYLPQYWHTTYLAKQQLLIVAMAKKYDGNPNILYIHMGIGCGAETLIDQTQPSGVRTGLWYQNSNAIGYSDVVWWSTIQSLAGYYKASFTKTPLAMLIDSTYIGNSDGSSNVNYDAPHTTNLYCKNNGIGIQNNGLTTTQTLSSSWLTPTSGQPLYAEQLNAATTSGRTVAGDLVNGVNTLGAKYCLLYGSDVADVPSQGALRWAYNEARKNSAKPTTPTIPTSATIPTTASNGIQASLAHADLH